VKASQQIIRRLVSITVSFVGLVLCLPMIPFIILAIRLSSPGPIFFKQTRVGLRGRPFSVIKFRTMRQDAEMNGAVWATKNDSRVTPLGRFMRKTRLDEIPQLWNVLRGEMGFVGPRPERPEFVEWLNAEIPFYDLRHIIRPGITGWAQVRYRYGASLEETKQKLEYDLYYVKHLSIGLDLLIMFETIKTIILRRGAQ
jgi:exopolysaccharide biosynthesis polyprenyl glycosylphosphotransferase